MSVNKVILVGNAGRDAEVRFTDQASGSGTKVATFTLATSERYRDRSGEIRENTEWHRIVAWRQLADLCEKFIKKGTQVYIEGKLRTRTYNDKDGAQKSVTEIVADSIQLLGRRPEGEEAGAAPSSYGRPAAPTYTQSQAPAAPAAGYSQAPAAAAGADDSDDLPF